MKRKHFLFAFLLLCFSFLSGTVAAASKPQEKKYVWFNIQKSYVFALYGTKEEALRSIPNTGPGTIAVGYDPDRRNGPTNPFLSITVIGNDIVDHAVLTTFSGGLTGNAKKVDITLFR